jgi:hypothetical protein
VNRWWLPLTWLVVGPFAVSVVPLLPLALAPDLGALGLALLLVAADDEAVVRWVVWVGLGVDLMSPAPFGLSWLGLLAAGLLGLELRHRFSLHSMSWLWPVWFAGITLIGIAPALLSTRSWSTAAALVVATTGWGTVSALLLQWFRASHPTVDRPYSYGNAL